MAYFFIHSEIQVQAKPSTYNLPPGDFAYGKALPRDKEGASLGY